MTAAEMFSVASLCLDILALLALWVAIYFLRKTPNRFDQSLPLARTYDQGLMDRQIAKLRRVASQPDAPTVPSLCTGKCKQGRNCTCTPAGRGAKP